MFTSQPTQPVTGQKMTTHVTVPNILWECFSGLAWRPKGGSRVNYFAKISIKGYAWHIIARHSDTQKPNKFKLKTHFCGNYGCQHVSKGHKTVLLNPLFQKSLLVQKNRFDSSNGHHLPWKTRFRRKNCQTVKHRLSIFKYFVISKVISPGIFHAPAHQLVQACGCIM